ncbi:MAG: hypothetical protein ACKPEA_03580, partial [Planctomycetota bacterium]
EAIDAARAGSAAWCAGESKRYRDRQADVLEFAVQRAKALGADAATNTTEIRAAAMLAIAQAEALLKSPPEWRISELSTKPLRSVGSLTRTWALLVTATFAISVAGASLIEGWKRVRLAARASG